MPFTLLITPVRATYHFNARTNKWFVKASRQVVNGDGSKREYTKQSFDDYNAALSFVSVFWGNA